MMERSQSFDLRDKNYNDVQKIMENVLKKNLSLSIDSKSLGNSLFRINYYENNIDKEQQKSNRITILQEPEKRVYIQINGRLRDSQVDQLWIEFKKNLNNTSIPRKIEDSSVSKEDIVEKLKNLIELKGYIVKTEEVQRFVKNFIEEYDRLPEKNEINSIVKGYMIMINEDYLLGKTEKSFENNSSLKNHEYDMNENKMQLNSNRNPTQYENAGGRRKCPDCGNEGLIHEMDDKNVIILDYPKIYGKKFICGQCSCEWR